MGVDEIIMEELGKAREDIIRSIDSTGLKASGKTQASIKVERGDGVYTMKGRRAFFTLERGRRPGKTPRNFVDIIKKWIKDKGVTYQPKGYIRKVSDRWKPKYTPEERGLNQAAGAIAYNIRRKGTRLHRQGGREDVYTPALDKAVGNIKKRVSEVYMAEIVDDIRKFSK